jgi:hypothetical protein
MDVTAALESEVNGNGSLPYSLLLELNVSDQEIIRELCAQAEGRERDEYALAALRLGVLTLRQARGVIDSQELKLAGERLLADVRAALSDHHTSVRGTLSATLQNYFDPTSGHFTDRINRLVRKDGDLANLLDRKITAVDSEMCRTLANHVGQGSPLFRLLSPSEADGVLAALRKCVEEQLADQRRAVLKEFSLDTKESALSRVVGQLKDSNGELQRDLKDRIGDLLKQFSFDDEQSALSRMAKTVGSISNHLTLDDENSALSLLKRELLGILTAQVEEARKFQSDVRLTLERIDVRKKERAASTIHGKDFELEVFDLIRDEAQRLGDLASFCGNTPGRISACKTGDVLVELGPESPAPGAKICIEAKEKRQYSLAEARCEIAKGRDNRNADAGLFVFSIKTAPAGLEPITRLGHDVYVFWDLDDPATDLYLRLGFSVARALCLQKAAKRETETADFEAIDKALLEINKQIEALDEIRVCAVAIDKNSEKIQDRLRISGDKLRKQIGLLAERLVELRALKDDTALE